MFQVAVYGKGGIGKSTMSANISFTLSKMGKTVTQIGCDPKHDSTRLLLNGNGQTTVLDYIRDTPVAERRLEDIMVIGSNGIRCIEAGGPEPGIGCAGRGILTTFDTLRKLGADGMDVDFRIYDVLGDVVCGGFAVPLRGEHADSIVLVTSGEFMSLYAANNIMKGLLNFNPTKPRIAGLIFNSRGVEDERRMVECFSFATGIPIIATMPRSRLFAQAEAAGRTVCEMFPESIESDALRSVAEHLISISCGMARMHLSKPLNDSQMTDIAAGKMAIPAQPMRSKCKVEGRKEGSFLLSCAAYGALNAATSVKGAAVVVHGPRSCTYLLSSSHNELVLSKPGSNEGYSKSIISTDMDDTISIFGGGDILRKGILDAIERGFQTVFIVTTCASGIIGDDVKGIVGDIGRMFPDRDLVLIEADGNIMGDYRDGYLHTIRVISGLIDPDVKPDSNYVNIIGTSYYHFRNGNNLDAVERVLSRFGLTVNCNFMDECSVDTIRGFYRAGLDILVSDDKGCNEAYRSICYSCDSRDSLIMPSSLDEIIRFIKALGRYTGREDVSDEMIEEMTHRASIEMDRQRSILSGKRALFYRDPYSNIDWCIKTAKELGMEVLKIGCGESRRGRPPLKSEFDDETAFNYTVEMIRNDTRELSPDLVIGDTMWMPELDVKWMSSTKHEASLDIPLDFARRLANMVRLPKEDGWRRLNDTQT